MLASLADHAYALMASSTSQTSECSLSRPQPLQSLQTAAPPPFLTKTYVMVDDPSTDAVVSWSHGHNSFIIWDPSEFSQKLLPRYFKHNNFASFVRQLNTYGFKKVDSDRWEFANEAFLRGQRHLLRNIHRKKPASQLQQIQAESSSSSMEVNNLGLEHEIGRLKHHKNVMMMEMGRLQQQQQVTNRELQSIGQRLHSTEQWQQHMMTFLAKAMKNPGLVAQLMHQTDSKQLEGAGRKRSVPSQGERSGEEEEPESASEGQLVKYASASKLDPFLRIEASSASFEAFLQEIGLPLQQLSREISSHESTSVQGATEVQDDISNPMVHEIKSKDGTHFSSLVLPDVGGSDGPPSLGDSTICKNDDNTDLMSLESGLAISNSVFGEEDSGTFFMEKMLEQLSVEIFWQ